MDAGAMHAKARDAGMDVVDWMNQYRERATRPSFHMSEEDARIAYNEEGIDGSGVPASARGAEIVQILEGLENRKEALSKEWLNADEDDQLQRTRRSIFHDTGYLGQGYEELHEEGADLVDELKEIRELARKVGDVGLWDYYLESKIGEDVVFGTTKVYTDDPLSIFSPKQLFPWEERSLVGGVLRAAPFVGELFQPIEEVEKIVKAGTGQGLAKRYRHRSQYDKILEFK